MEDLWSAVQEAWYAIPQKKKNAKNLWKIWVVNGKLSSKTKAIAQNINSRAFVHTKKINKCNIKRTVLGLCHLCVQLNPVLFFFYKLCIFF